MKEDGDWMDFDSEFGLDQMNTWRPIDDYGEDKPKFLDDPEDFTQDFFGE